MRSPVTNGRSRSSTSLVMQRRGLRVGAGDDQRRHAGDVGGEPGRVERADVLAGRDQHLAAEVAALLLGGELVLPVHAGRAGGDHRGHQLVRVERATEAGLGVGDDRGQPVVRGRRALGGGDLVGAQQRVVDAAHDGRHRVGRVEALVRVGLPGEVGVGRHLPAGQVDRLQAGPHHLDGLVAGQRAERVDVVLLVQQRPEPLRAPAGQRVLLLDRAAQAYDVVRAVGAFDALPPRVGGPLVLQLLRRCRHRNLLGTLVGQTLTRRERNGRDTQSANC